MKARQVTYRLIIFLICLVIFPKPPISGQLDKPVVSKELIFEERDGVAAVEAEFFYKQSKSHKRRWYRTSKSEWAKPGRDADGPHCKGAGNNAYIEVLPDTRVTHADQLIKGENFTNAGGEIAVLHYKVHINTPGRYYVWVRAYSSGSEDNGLHVGLNGNWPKSGLRLQWCKGKKTWRWESMQRTKEAHCGVPDQIYLDIDSAGVHDIQFSMREDGFEFDKFILTRNIDFSRPEGYGPDVIVKSGKLPQAFLVVEQDPILEKTFMDVAETAIKGTVMLKAVAFPLDNTDFYIDRKKWLGIHPEKHKEATVSRKFEGKDGVYDAILIAVGENDGKSEYKVSVNSTEVGHFVVPLSEASFEEGVKYCELWENIDVKRGDLISVWAKVGTDGKEYSRGRWSAIVFVPVSKGKELLEALKGLNIKENVGQNAKPVKKKPNPKPPKLKFTDKNIRKPNGSGNVEISGQLKQWHKVTLTLDGPFAHELDNKPNPFLDYNMSVVFAHESGEPVYTIPAYFSADGNAAESGADNGTKWRAHLSPDKTGKWNYTINFMAGPRAAVSQNANTSKLAPYDGVSGSFSIDASDKTGKDFRAKGRLEYVGKHYLQFQGSKEYFLKAGSDAPETFLAYHGFDATYTVKPNVPIKKFDTHIKDWKKSDPTWRDGKGKGIIGALNYLEGKGLNAFSFLTYNAGGDGDNVWPFVDRNQTLQYDCSKLDQWGIVFDHAQKLGLYCHFKTQETENDDLFFGRHQKPRKVSTALDDGTCGPERLLYYRELIARYAYLLALNWNLGEENTQSPELKREMASFFAKNCPYKHNIVIHTYPELQNEDYFPLLGNQSELTGVSLQNRWHDTHLSTLNWVTYSGYTLKPWVVANDEQGPAGSGVPPDPGYNGYDMSTTAHTLHDIRKQTLWGNLMAGGAGVEYYFGYKLPENDLLCEDFRSRDKSWDFCKIALDFFANHKIPFWEMKNENHLVGNKYNTKEKYCFAKAGELYLVYLGYTKTSTLDLTKVEGDFSVMWFNPIEGGKLKSGKVKKVSAGQKVELGLPPSKQEQDWLVVVKKL